jgi:hypothetical protein
MNRSRYPDRLDFANGRHPIAVAFWAALANLDLNFSGV